MKDYDTDSITVKELKKILENHKDDETMFLLLNISNNSGDAKVYIGDENILYATVFNP